MCSLAIVLAYILTMQTCSAVNAACPVILQVRVAELQSEIVRCTVSGSGFPGLARQHQLAGLTAGLASTLPEEALLWGKAETGRLPKGTITTGKGGAGIFLCRVTLAVVPSMSSSTCHHSCLSCLGICKSLVYTHFYTRQCCVVTMVITSNAVCVTCFAAQCQVSLVGICVR